MIDNEIAQNILQFVTAESMNRTKSFALVAVAIVILEIGAKLPPFDDEVRGDKTNS